MRNKNEISSSDLLKPENMLRLYASGAFPMADEITGEINWYMPEIRTIIPLDNFNIPRSLKKFLDNSDFEFKYDNDFLSVVKNCADRETTWISDKLIDAYLKLHKLGHIHTVETWRKGKLVGGLYGVAFRGAFFGESMFSKVEQASKAALAKLIVRLNEKNFVILDVQYMTEHLKMFGAEEIPFDEYQQLLFKAYQKNCTF
jgi:leucyl/phenylalanyl-tRNA---protein transferase